MKGKLRLEIVLLFLPFNNSNI